MAPLVKASRGMSRLAGSDSEPGFDDLAVPDKAYTRDASRKDAPVKRPRGRPPAANKVSKPVQKAKRTAGSAASSTVTARQALVEKSNVNTLQPISPGKKDRRHDSATKIKGSRGRPPKDPSDTKRASSDIESPQKETSNLEDMDVDSGKEDAEAEQESEASIDADEDAALGDREVEYGTEEAPLRRRLGELTKKYESLETKYRDLREVGVKAAERNFDRLKKQTNENSAASDDLIAQLKEELADHRKRERKAEELRRDLEQSETNASELEAKVSDLSSSLSDARREIKALTAKLTSSRTAESSVKVPGSALKGSQSNNLAQQSGALQAAQAKEDLYGDLTGLIVRGLTRHDDQDVFDCIQTGRNGTLHFKLAVEAGDSSDSYNDVRFTYQPQLDPDRDGDMMDVLPDYFADELEFPRINAVHFYNKIANCLMERLD